MSLVEDFLNHANAPSRDFIRYTNKRLVDYVQNNKVLNDYFAARKVKQEIVIAKNNNRPEYDPKYLDNFLEKFRGNTLKYLKGDTNFYINANSRNRGRFYWIRKNSLISKSIVDNNNIGKLKNILYGIHKKYADRRNWVYSDVDFENIPDPLFTIKQDMINWRIIPYRNGLPDNKCSICQAEFREGNLIVSHKNMHLFHRKCINQWYWERDKKNCPIDRERYFGYKKNKKNKKLKKNNKSKKSRKNKILKLEY